MPTFRSLALAAGATLLMVAPAAAQTLDSLTLNGFRWREIGPANFEGRVSDIVGIPSPSKTFFVAAAAGGVWKTTNNGITYRPVFENERVASMGALAIAPSDTMQVWAGTGEPNSRNSIEPGGGIYKSTDGGLTWKLMGLEKTEHIGHIVVHPTNPDIVYVAALGAAWRTNPERGLYKTTDGGQTWKLVKHVSDRAGFINVQLDPKNPDVVWASSWERIRGPYFLNSGGPGSALWKSTDGGATWAEIRGGGFPETPKGRIEIAIYPGDPNIVYTMVEADSIRGRKAAPGAERQKLANGLYRTKDGGRTWEKMNDANTRPFYYSQVRVHPRNPDRVWFSSTPVLVSNDGGKTTQTATNGIHVDHHAMWIDPNDPDRMIVGNDGGVSVSFDGGGNYDFGAVLPIAQFYNVSFDYNTPYDVCAGAQDNGSWCGPSRRKNGRITNADWFMFLFGDGFVTQQDPTDPNIIYGESQGGNIARFDRSTSVSTRLVKPDWRPRYTQWEDSLVVARGDTTQPAPRDVARRLTGFRTSQQADSASMDMRWNWNTPYFLSPHNPQVLYAGANRVLKSTKRGDGLYPISPDLSKKQMAKIDTSMNKTGGITLDATGAETYGTIVSLAESPVKPGFLYAGTDDGNVWMTRNDGATWEELPASRFPGLPAGGAYVSEIEPSYADSMTFYVSFDNHRVGDFKPYLYVSNDGGRTFRSLVANLPTGGPDYVHVIKEDPYNPDLLFVGTSVGAYMSLDRGASWQKFMTGMPTTPVYDLKIHPRDRELIAATHGRGIWIVDIAPLEQMAGARGRQVIASAAHLFEPVTARQYAHPTTPSPSPSGPGHQWFAAESPAYGAEITYRIGGSAQPAATTSNGTSDGAGNGAAQGGRAQGAQQGAQQGARGGQRAQRPQARIVITNVKGDTVQTLTGPATPGVHRVTWNYRTRGMGERAPLSPSQRRDSALTAQRREFVLDSLEKAGTFPQPVVAQLRNALASGDMGALFRRGGGGGGGGAAGGWNARPGEGPVTPPPGERPRGQAPQAGQVDVMGALESFPGGARGFQELLRPPGVRTAPAFGGGFGGGGSGVTESGDFLVTLVVNGTTSHQVLRVEAVPGGDQGGGRFVSEEEEGRDR
ncbi:MAG TPA: hypothetical protein VFX39_03260 [Gemmatimonadaceae bacterium]|nr:hypothetical protein [Gemmatimonadaceae bacterium]